MYENIKGICPGCGCEMEITSDLKLRQFDRDSEPYYTGVIISDCKECGYYNEEII